MKTSFLILQLVLLLSSLPVFANHSFGGLDMCALYPEVMPPGLMLGQMPESGGKGAVLMQSYCTQCHALPGPGRHTAKEWPQVLDRMLVLMDVANRFGGLLGRVNTPTTEEREQLSSYLNRYALKPLSNPLSKETHPQRLQGLGATAFENHCGNCHALPDPAQYRSSDWTGLTKRMQRNMVIMKYPLPSSEVMMQIQLFLQQHSQQPSLQHAGLQIEHQSENPESYISASVGAELFSVQQFRGGRWLALGPFFVLMVLGLVRWRNSRIKVKAMLDKQMKI